MSIYPHYLNRKCNLATSMLPTKIHLHLQFRCREILFWEDRGRHRVFLLSEPESCLLWISVAEPGSSSVCSMSGDWGKSDWVLKWLCQVLHFPPQRHQIDYPFTANRKTYILLYPQVNLPSSVWLLWIFCMLTHLFLFSQLWLSILCLQMLSSIHVVVNSSTSSPMY